MRASAKIPVDRPKFQKLRLSARQSLKCQRKQSPPWDISKSLCWKYMKNIFNKRWYKVWAALTPSLAAGDRPLRATATTLWTATEISKRWQLCALWVKIECHQNYVKTNFANYWSCLMTIVWKTWLMPEWGEKVWWITVVIIILARYDKDNRITRRNVSPKPQISSSRTSIYDAFLHLFRLNLTISFWIGLGTKNTWSGLGKKHCGLAWTLWNNMVTILTGVKTFCCIGTFHQLRGDVLLQEYSVLF